MRVHPAWGLILFFFAMLAAGSVAHGAETHAGYDTRTLEGFTVHVNKNVVKQGNDRFGRRPLDVLEKELNDLRRILAPKIVEVLQSVPIWAEWDETDKLSPGAVARYYGGTAEGLLVLGGNPKKANCVEVLTLRRLGEIRAPGTALQQVIILHEMCHVVHHRMLGWANPELEATFQSAVDRKLYDAVNDRFGRRVKAYARTSAAEYFAEISCAYLDSCNYFPFNQEQLKGYDPAGAKFVERVWKEPERFQVLAFKPKNEGPKADAVPEPTPGGRTDVYAERDALLKFDRLRAMSREGDKELAKKGLKDLIRVFQSTAAAADARELLKTLK